MNQRLVALDFLTNCLSILESRDFDNSLYSTVVSGRLHWPTILAIANAQRIAPAFWAALRNRKLVEHLPAEVREYLFREHFLNTLKNKQFREQAIAVTRQLNAIGVEPVLLKGAVSLFVKLFNDFGSRVMVDLDILVPDKVAEDCWNALHILGYRPVEEDTHHPNLIDYAHHHHLRPLHHPNQYGSIEIHRDVLPMEVASMLSTQLIFGETEPVVNQWGLAMSVPSPTHRVLHNLLHSDLINQMYSRGEISLRALHELAMMQVVYQEQIDWQRIRRLLQQGGREKVLNASLYLAHQLLGSPMPERIHSTPRAVVHYARTRVQFRWNWIHEVVERIFWFSTQNIRERYHCDYRRGSVAKGRLRLAAEIIWNSGSRLWHRIRLSR